MPQLFGHLCHSIFMLLINSYKFCKTTTVQRIHSTIYKWVIIDTGDGHQQRWLAMHKIVVNIGSGGGGHIINIGGWLSGDHCHR